MGVVGCSPTEDPPAGDSDPRPDESSTAATVSSDNESEAEGGWLNFDLPEDLCGWCSPAFDAEPECPEGEKCTVTSCYDPQQWPDAFGCRPIGGDKQHGEACSFVDDLPGTGLDDCADRVGCFWGVCQRYCNTNFSCPQGSECLATGNGTPMMCFDYCDPLDPSDCGGLQSCFEQSWSFICMGVRSQEAAGPGEACTYQADCEYGAHCIPAELLGADCPGEACCTPYCDTTTPNTCPGLAQGEQCVPVLEPGEAMLPEQQKVGTCRLPPG